MRAILMREFAWTGPGISEWATTHHVHTLATGYYDGAR